MKIERRSTQPKVALRRSLTIGPLLFYGLAIIVGAGIYVAIASVIGRAGAAAPLSFLLAGTAAAMTGLCYAELASRFPEASGAVAYVTQGFGSDRAAQVTGIALTLAVAIAAASIASGAVHYLSLLIGLSPWAMITLLVVTFTLLAMAGVRESVGFAAIIGTIEILGLLVAAAVGFLTAPDFNIEGMWPTTFIAWQNVVAGAFIAFFAFIGFESLANMAEEAKDPRRTLPYSIVAAVLVSTLLYVVVAGSLVFARTGGQSPLIDLFQDRYATLFAAVGALAIANGVLVEIMMLARLFYGMARRRQLPAILGRVHSRTRTPIEATALAGAIVLATALLVPFERLLALANALTLGIFAVVDIALWRIQRRLPAGEGVFTVPRWVPPAAAALAVGLIVSEIFS
ncbi:APC family permease [Pseudorhodoplanes sp.]|uniref:APC family permease n=1 Tax=Pseudorhodoplanes sp. TaxID=1934341 RepID=UPI002C7EEDD4|nr:amino acid permease [Pseudorhodoplanes sp.]HWV55080.1 amino acid permease [Pseudorhodoplanes sp.]